MAVAGSPRGVAAAMVESLLFNWGADGIGGT